MAAEAAADDPAPAPDAAVVEPTPRPPTGPLKIMSWNVGTSPYAMAMRKIKSSTPAWRTSFGAERRTVEAPAAPQASDIDADVVLLQGIINPRAMRRLFPARKWRLMFSPRAVEALPKGSVFTAPVSSVEVEAIAVRYREGLRITGRVEMIGDPVAASPAGIAVRLAEKGRTVWAASVAMPKSCTPDAPCPASAALLQWRQQHAAAGDALIVGGRTEIAAPAATCNGNSIEAVAPGSLPPPPAFGENSGIFGCLAVMPSWQP